MGTAPQGGSAGEKKGEDKIRSAGWRRTDFIFSLDSAARLV